MNKKVPKTVKDSLWDETFGPEAGQGRCYVCSRIINSKNFEAGHVIPASKGGPPILPNLRCICSKCNKSMGVQHLEFFKELYYPKDAEDYKKNSCSCCKKDSDITKENYYYDSDEERDKLLVKLKQLNKFRYKPST